MCTRDNCNPIDLMQIWRLLISVGRLITIHLSLIFGFFKVYHSVRVWPTALKLGCITNFATLFLVMGFISLVDEIQFMLISSRHIVLVEMRPTAALLYNDLG